MTLANVLANTTFNGYSAGDQATIEGLIGQIYGTATGQAMIDGYLAGGGAITFNFSANNAAASAGGGNVFYDLAFSPTLQYIDLAGTSVQEQAVGTVAHELVHALTGRLDNWQGQADYSGDTVTFTNAIFRELGVPEQLSYPGSSVDPSVLDLGRNYTAGQSIDRAWTNDANWISAGAAADLLVGGAGANTLRGGGGNDILVGNGGNDVLDGGGGVDVAVYEGNQLDYDVRQNADGSWSVKHVRGAMDEGDDTLFNIERIRFDAGSSYDLKKGALTFQTDFALVIDTTGSMGSSINAVKSQAAALIEAAFDGGNEDARIGVVGFKDNTIGEPTTIIQSFTDQTAFADRKADALAAINGISVSGGGDLPETAFDGLLKALDGTMGDWRVGASIKRVALFTDASAKDGSLAGTVNALASNIGATITRTASIEGERGALHEFTFELPPLLEAGRIEPDTTPRDVGTPTVDPSSGTTTTTVQIFTIYTGPSFNDTTNLKDVAEANGGAFFTPTTNEELVELLFEIIELPPNAIPEVDGPVDLGEASGPRAVVITQAQLLEGATDADADDVLSVTGLSASAGTVVLNDDGTWTYTPPAGGTGEVTFTYTVTDGEASIGQTATLDLSGGGTGGGGDGLELRGTGRADVLVGGAGDDVIKGRAGDDLLSGLGGDDRLFGSGGVDTLDGGAGDDRLAGHAGDDLFVFRDGWGRDVVVDFTDGDRLVFELEGIDDFAAFAEAADLRQRKDNVFIDLGEDRVILRRTDLDALDADDFLFA